LAIVRPEIVTVMVTLEEILKMRKGPLAGLRWMVNRFAPGPAIFIPFLSINNCPFVSVIALCAGSEKVIVSNSTAFITASRNVHLLTVHVPAPSSAVLFTVSVAASADPATRRAKRNLALKVRYAGIKSLRSKDFFVI
jgi:hypothetical protein